MSSRSYTYHSSSKTGTASKGSGKAAPSGPSPELMAQKLGIKKVKSVLPLPLALTHPKKRTAVRVTQDEYDEESGYAEENGLARVNESKPKRVRKGKDEEPEEKRLKRFRVKPPQTYLQRLERVKTQRMFLIDRKRFTSSDGAHEEEVFDIAGSTGNIYQVTVSKVPKCTCPDASKGNQCKHIIYVLVNVLKANEALAYQLAFLSTELAGIFAHAPITPQSSDSTARTTDTGGHRKPIEGDCPVCVMEFDESDKSESILWCKGACGQNIHRHCFEQWAKSKAGPVKCVYCRTIWKGDEETVKRISKSGNVNEEGFINVASELGLSRQRDMSSYHQYWVRQQDRESGGNYAYQN